MYHSNSFSGRWIGRTFPLPAYVGKESLSRCTVFSKYFAAAITVVADGRSADHDLRQFLHFCNCFRNEPCTFDAAVTNPSLLSSGPSSGSNVLPGEMNQCINSIDCPRIHCSLFRIPSG